MSYFRKFSDFCSGFSAFMALIYLFRQFMTYSFPEEEVEGMKDKLKLFFSKDSEYDNLLLLILAGFFVLSVVAGRVFARYPHISLVFTVPPIVMTADMIKAEYIKEYPLLYAVFGCIAVAGGIYECVRRDRLDGKKRSAFGGNLVSLSSAAFCYWIYSKVDRLTELAEADMSSIPEEDAVEISRFDQHIQLEMENMDMRVFMGFAVTFAVLVLISLLLSDIYFIHGILAAVPMFAAMYMWSAGNLTVHPELLVTFTVINFAVRAVPAVSGVAKQRYKEKEKKESPTVSA